MPIMDTDLGLLTLAVAQANGTVVKVPTPDYVFNFKTAASTIIVRYGSHTPDGTIRVLDGKTKKFLGYVFTSWWGAAFAIGRNANLDANGMHDARQYDWRGEVWEADDATAPVQLGPGDYNTVVASQKKLTKGAYPAIMRSLTPVPLVSLLWPLFIPLYMYVSFPVEDKIVK